MRKYGKGADFIFRNFHFSSFFFFNLLKKNRRLWGWGEKECLVFLFWCLWLLRTLFCPELCCMYVAQPWALPELSAC
jgi:hypothetical protein